MCPHSRKETCIGQQESDFVSFPPSSLPFLLLAIPASFFISLPPLFIQSNIDAKSSYKNTE